MIIIIMKEHLILDAYDLFLGLQGLRREHCLPVDGLDDFFFRSNRRCPATAA